MKKGNYNSYVCYDSTQRFMVGDYVIARDFGDKMHKGRLNLGDREFIVDCIEEDFSFPSLYIFPMSIDDFIKYKTGDNGCYLRSMITKETGGYSAKLNKTLDCVENEYLLTIEINGFRVCEAYVRNMPMMQHIINSFNLSIDKMEII